MAYLVIHASLAHGGRPGISVAVIEGKPRLRIPYRGAPVTPRLRVTAERPLSLSVGIRRSANDSVFGESVLADRNATSGASSRAPQRVDSARSNDDSRYPSAPRPSSREKWTKAK